MQVELLFFLMDRRTVVVPYFILSIIPFYNSIYHFFMPEQWNLSPCPQSLLDTFLPVIYFIVPIKKKSSFHHHRQVIY